MAGAANESVITLTRGREQAIREVRVGFSNAVAGDYVQVFRKDSATTANERTDSHADSLNVLYAEGYFGNGDLVLSSQKSMMGGSDARGVGLIVRISSTQAGTAYINIAYDYA